MPRRVVVQPPPIVLDVDDELAERLRDRGLVERFAALLGSSRRLGRAVARAVKRPRRGA
jgi:hypothetical protein